MTVYTLFGQSGGGSNPSDTSDYTLGVQFSVGTAGCTLTGIWWYSGSWATTLPSQIALYQVSGTSLVTSQAATWSGAAGSGWVRAAVTSPPALTSGAAYKACVLGNSTSDFYSATANYWSSGPGSGGITSGPLSAPNTSGASPSQDSYNNASSLAYPGTASGNASNYWVDPEITAPAPPVTATVTAFMASM